MFWIPIIIAVAASVAASYLLQPKVPDTSALDDSRTNPSTRGTLTPFLLGRAQIGPIMSFVGARYTTKERTDYHSDSPKQTVYYEKAIHVLCVGPAKQLNAIYEDGEEIFSGPITPDTHPSGTLFDLGYGRKGDGRFRIYWGEPDQPIDTSLAASTGVSSRYPYVCYISWDSKRLGMSSTWPSLEYDIEVDTTIQPVDGEYITYSTYEKDITATFEGDLSSADLIGYSSILGTDNTSSFAFRTTDENIAGAEVGYTAYIDSLAYSGRVIGIFSNGSDYLVFLNTFLSASEVGNSFTLETTSPDGRGVNPASALYQMLFDSYPHGLGMSQSLFDLSSIETLATLFKNTEPAPCTISIAKGKSFKTAIDYLLQDFGLLFYKDVNTGLYGFRAMREGDEVVSIPADNYQSGDMKREFAYATLDSDVTVYSFKDSSRKFTDSTITVTDDGKSQYSDNANSTKTVLNTITDLTTATSVASRREQESSLNEAFSLSLMGEGMSSLVPGDLLNIEGFSANYRLLEISIDPDSAEVKVGAMLDAYSTTNNYEARVFSGLQALNTISPSPDPVLLLLEGNRYLHPDQDVFYFLRVRRHGYITGSDSYSSKDGSTYDLLSSTSPPSTGGILAEEILEEAPGIIDEGPLLTVIGPDIGEVVDLSFSTDLWRSGYQMAFIGDEIFFLRNYNEATGKLEGLIRARAGTKAVYHPVGEKVLILLQDDLSTYTASYLQNGSNLYAKSVPYTDSDALELSDVDPEQITYKGGGFRPLPPENFTTTDLTGAWVAGADVEMRWDYKNALDKSGAGIGESDAVSDLSLPEGYFKLEILNGSTVVRTVDSISLGNYTYTNANMVADFGSEPSTFSARVVNVLNGLISDEDTATFTRV